MLYNPALSRSWGWGLFKIGNEIIPSKIFLIGSSSFIYFQYVFQFESQVQTMLQSLLQILVVHRVSACFIILRPPFIDHYFYGQLLNLLLVRLLANETVGNPWISGLTLPSYCKEGPKTPFYNCLNSLSWRRSPKLAVIGWLKQIHLKLQNRFWFLEDLWVSEEWSERSIFFYFGKKREKRYQKRSLDSLKHI